MNAIHSREELIGKPVLVIGMGRSGMAAARLLSAVGADVFVTESRPVEQVQLQLRELEAMNIAWEAGGHEQALKSEVGFAIVSPGVPISAPVVKALKDAGRPIYSEVELASWFYLGTIIAVTGSNGKTTTTLWIEHLLRQAGIDAVACGNVGYSFSDMVREYPTATQAVVEVSSYQLESVLTFHPHVTVLTNISPDHLERHGSLEVYAEAKARIWMNQDMGDWAVMPDGDELVARISASIRPHKISVSMYGCPEGGVGLEGEILWLNTRGRRTSLLALEDLPLPGMHNAANALSAAAACDVLQVTAEEIAEGLKSFAGVPHRLETVGENGRIWINDSKATNVDSVRVALEAVHGPVWLIAGGQDKGASYEPLSGLVKDKVEKILTIGAGSTRIADELGGFAEIVPCDTLEKAVGYAAKEARVGVTVLLSPGCASFDQFHDFEDRGERYRALVKEVVAR